MVVRIVFDDIRCELIAEGASWNPDVASDMINRVTVLWWNALSGLMETGVMEMLYGSGDECGCEECAIEWDEDEESEEEAE